ncbi:hypothetical protein [Paraburkholderia tropica]|uniref:hypothetical protein n=1 Tax=Paraburkholderia tropica TaxID=92647 RepID=UPI0007EDD2B4|nr:hypothetical protein [Paraburkholderia tropica]MBB2983181.1 Ni/Co efflux regulator RcnB [Paraburkholderia tropica]OBR49938.1 hypothetical protein A6456_23785 [Paraburkholderia tropica]
MKRILIASLALFVSAAAFTQTASAAPAGHHHKHAHKHNGKHHARRDVAMQSPADRAQPLDQAPAFQH